MTERHGWHGLVDVDADAPNPDSATAEDTDPDLKPVRAGKERKDDEPRVRGAAKAPDDQSKDRAKLPRPGPRGPVREVVRETPSAPVRPSAPPAAPPKLKLPSAAPASEGPRRVQSAPPPSPIADLVEDVEAAPRKPMSPKGSWKDYKELIATGVIGAIVLGSVIAYQAFRPPSTAIDPEIVHVTPPPPDQPDPEQPDPPVDVPPRTGTEPDPESPSDEAAKPKVRMVSIVSTPPGATAEVNGAAWGVTPIIRAHEGEDKALEVVLTLKGYKEFRDVITPDESGHFTVTTTLEREGR